MMFKCILYHNWNKWVTFKVNSTRPCRPGDGNPFLSGVMFIEYSNYIQRRTCKDCGKEQEREV